MEQSVEKVMEDYSEKGIEECLDRLNEIAEQMEESDLKLEEAIVLYQEGMVAVHRCNQILGAAQQKAEVLRKLGENSFETEELEPFTNP